MELQEHSLFDRQFVTAEIATTAGIIAVQAEIQPGRPMHIEQATWKESGDGAMSYVSQHLAEVRDLIKEVLPASA